MSILSQSRICEKKHDLKAPRDIKEQGSRIVMSKSTWATH